MASLKKNPGLIGNNYRNEWKQNIKGIPYLDLTREKGGLKILKRGGGLQTRSLRLADAEGRQFALRSIEKYPEQAIPENLRGTIAGDMIKELVSASHPYGAFGVPRLAEAAGIYHTNPQLYYLPRDPVLGGHINDFSTGLFLMEERPHKSQGDLASFGKPGKIISTPDVLDKIRNDNEKGIDQNWVMKSRLFDIWIGDWDRHDDQWRWGKFETEGDYDFYRPIPRDRDQAFFWSDGLLIKYFTTQPGVAKFQGFKHRIKNVNTMSFNARHFDRTFLSEPTLDEWITTADSLQQRLTDKVIEDGISDLPPEIFAFSGPDIIAKLKTRRNDLKQYAREYYLFLAKNVDVVGSHEREVFDVERGPNGRTNITVRNLKKSGQPGRIIYQRSFLRSETREVRLYGLGGDDVFNVTGKADKGPRVRLIGGRGQDVFNDDSKVNGLAKRTLVYDTRQGNELHLGREAGNRTSNRPGINNYDRNAFQYDQVTPFPYIDISPDDGIFLSFDLMWTRHGFRKTPYASYQKYRFRWSPRTKSYKLLYRGDFVGAFGYWDFWVEADFRFPSYTDYYYGLGNESVLDEALREDRFYHFRFAKFELNPRIKRVFEHRHSFFFGPNINLYKLTENNDTNRQFLVDFPNAELGDLKYYLGPVFSYTFDSRDSESMPTQGLLVNLDARHTFDLGDDSISFSTLSTDIAYYISTGGSLNTTLAVRAGGAMNLGDFEFYQAVDLGGKRNLRGHRRMRFSGEQSAYLNTDLRMKVAEIVTPVFPAAVGIFGFFDLGKVWFEDAQGNDPTVADGKSDIWHRGFGGGAFISPFNAFLVNFDISWSSFDSGAVKYFRFGFLF